MPSSSSSTECEQFCPYVGNYRVNSVLCTKMKGRNFWSVGLWSTRGASKVLFVFNTTNNYSENKSIAASRLRLNAGRLLINHLQSILFALIERRIWSTVELVRTSPSQRRVYAKASWRRCIESLWFRGVRSIVCFPGQPKEVVGCMSYNETIIKVNGRL